MSAADRVPVPARGALAYQVLEDGRVVERVAGANVVVLGMYPALAAALAGAVDGRVVYLGVGAGNADPTPADVSLTHPVFVPLLGASANGLDVTFRWEIGRADANGIQILEFGLFTAGGAMIARKTRTAPIAKTPRLTLRGAWTLTFAPPKSPT